MSYTMLVDEKTQDTAVRHALAVYKLVEKARRECGNKEKKNPVLTRVRSAPGTIASYGLTPLLAFHYSKTEKPELIVELYRLIHGKENEGRGGEQRLSNDLCEELLSESKGHVAFLALLLGYLVEDLKAVNREDGVRSREDVPQIIRELNQSPKKNIATLKTISYLTFLKNILSGLFGEEGE